MEKKTLKSLGNHWLDMREREWLSGFLPGNRVDSTVLPKREVQEEKWNWRDDELVMECVDFEVLWAPTGNVQPWNFWEGNVVEMQTWVSLESRW